MKKLLFLALMLFPLITIGQTIKRDSKGNYYSAKAIKDSSQIKTGNTFTDSKGKIWPVYKTKTGRVYALRTSKSGKQYRYYLDKKQ